MGQEVHVTWVSLMKAFDLNLKRNLCTHSFTLLFTLSARENHWQVSFMGKRRQYWKSPQDAYAEFLRQEPRKPEIQRAKPPGSWTWGHEKKFREQRLNMGRPQTLLSSTQGAHQGLSLLQFCQEDLELVC